jgi:hypothetical protein
VPGKITITMPELFKLLRNVQLGPAQSGALAFLMADKKSQLVFDDVAVSLNCGTSIGCSRLRRHG